MRFSELNDQIPNKKRSIKDLARFVGTRADLNPNFSLLLGAGCSVTSGIRSANSLVTEWRNEICQSLGGPVEASESLASNQREYLKSKHSAWYDPAREYSSLFEKRYDLQPQRRMFVEKEVSGKSPSIGYLYLTHLVSQQYFNTIFTTNFDDLINEAFYSFSDQRPIVCAHDSSINSITVTSKRPKIIKLHGDYLFEDLKATTRETESLEHNMRLKFTEFAKVYGLIVVGYSGSDRSIMDVLMSLLKHDDYFKGGIYWCLRPDSEVSEDLRKLLWRDRVYFVEVAGYDELLAELHSEINDGDALPLSKLSTGKKPHDLVNKLLQSLDSMNTQSEIILRAKHFLSEQSKQASLMSLLLEIQKERSSPESSFTDEEVMPLVEIQRHLVSKSYSEVLELGERALTQFEKPSAKRQVLRMMVSAFEGLKRTSDAISTSDRLISLQPNDARSYLIKSGLLDQREKKRAVINKAIEADPHSFRAYWAMADVLDDDARNSHGPQKAMHVKSACQYLEKGIQKNPHYSNPCWRLKFDVILNHEDQKAVKKKALTEIIQAIEVQDPFCLRVLSMRASMIDSESTDHEVSDLIETIDSAGKWSDPEDRLTLERLRLLTYSSAEKQDKVESTIAALYTDANLHKHDSLSRTIAAILRTKLGRDSDAIELLARNLKFDFSADTLLDLVSAHSDLGNVKECKELFGAHAEKLSQKQRLMTEMEVAEAQNDAQAAFVVSQKLREVDGEFWTAQSIYFLLLSEDYKKAKLVAKEALEAINFAPDAQAVIINYEYARMKLGDKPNQERMNMAVSFRPKAQVKAAVSAILGKKEEFIKYLREAVQEDNTFRFDAAKWPVFRSFQSDADFKRALQIK